MNTPLEDTPSPADERITKIGLLMEAAITYQQSAEEALNRLKAHTQGIDAIVRDEIRRTLVDEFQGLDEECRRATQSLQSVKRAANLRVTLSSIGIAAICTCIAVAALSWLLPSKAEIAALRAQRDRFSETVVQLERHGGRIDLRRCGNDSRLCVRIDMKAPTFGEHQDYRIVQEN